MQTPPIIKSRTIEMTMIIIELFVKEFWLFADSPPFKISLFELDCLVVGSILGSTLGRKVGINVGLLV